MRLFFCSSVPSLLRLAAVACVVVGSASAGCTSVPLRDGGADAADSRVLDADVFRRVDVIMVDAVDVPVADDGPSEIDVASPEDAMAEDTIDVPVAVDAPTCAANLDYCPLSGCVDLQSSLQNCGACNAACVRNNAVAECRAGMCELGACAANFGNCDMMPANGCETRLDSVQHCGRCGNSCPFAPNVAPVCLNGTCGFGACNLNFGNCDMMPANGCESNFLSDPLHCGNCMTRCPTPMNGTATCVMGMCSQSCNAGSVLVGGRCVPMTLAPRQLLPLSLGDTSLRRPTLRWNLPAEFDGAQVELCRDRACTMVIETLRVPGSMARPAMTLPARGVVFWRLRGMVGAALAPGVSATWLFHVPAVDATRGIDTSTHPHLDVNGDGFDDLVVGAWMASPGGRAATGSATIYHGSAMGIAMAPTRVLEGAASNDNFGEALGGAGDVNGDGFGDLLVGAEGASPGGQALAGTATLYYGSAMGLSAMPARVINGPTAMGLFGTAVATAGDVNSDGYADVLIGSSGALYLGVATGTASVYHGGATGLGAMPALVLGGTNAGDLFGQAVASAGDVNGDGYSDIIVGGSFADPAGRANAGSASIYYGSAMGIAPMAAAVFAGLAAGDQLGYAATGAGDLNNDGFSDVAVGIPYADPLGRNAAGVVRVYLGAAGGVGNPLLSINGSNNADLFGYSVSNARDVNGDGYSELFVGAREGSGFGRGNAGYAQLFLGSMLGPTMMFARQLEAQAGNDQFGCSVAGVGDLNGDGYADVAVGARQADPGGRGNAGTAGVYTGGAMGIAMLPSRLLEGVAAGDQFGDQVAR